MAANTTATVAKIIPADLVPAKMASEALSEINESIRRGL